MKAAENNKGVKFYNWQHRRNVFTISTLPEHRANLVPASKKNRHEDVSKPPSVLSSDGIQEVRTGLCKPVLGMS